MSPNNVPSLDCSTYMYIKCFSGTLFIAILSLLLGVAVIDNLVYAVGGSNRDDGTRSNLNSMERYNPEKDEWEDMPPMHRSRGAASVTALNGCLYAVGGYDSGNKIWMLLSFIFHVPQIVLCVSDVMCTLVP